MYTRMLSLTFQTSYCYTMPVNDLTPVFSQFPFSQLCLSLLPAFFRLGIRRVRNQIRISSKSILTHPEREGKGLNSYSSSDFCEVIEQRNGCIKMEKLHTEMLFGEEKDDWWKSRRFLFIQKNVSLLKLLVTGRRASVTFPGPLGSTSSTIPFQHDAMHFLPK